MVCGIGTNIEQKFKKIKNNFDMALTFNCPFLKHQDIA